MVTSNASDIPYVYHLNIIYTLLVLCIFLIGVMAMSLSACGNIKLTNKNIDEFVTLNEKCDTNNGYISKVYVTIKGNSNYKFENANVVVKVGYGVYHSF